MDQLWINARLATFDPAVCRPYGEVGGRALLVNDGHIAGLIPPPADFDGTVHDAGGRWITPGLIDCHTHLVSAGNRAAEWEQRLGGVPYAEIAKHGGGILNTVRATR